MPLCTERLTIRYIAPEDWSAMLALPTKYPPYEKGHIY